MKDYDMDSREFDARVKRLNQVSEAIANLDPAIRTAAFEMLKDFVTDDDSGGESDKVHSRNKSEKRTVNRTRRRSAPTPKEPVGDNSQLGRDEFFLKFDHDKPSDNALAIAAWYYNQYGKTSFTLKEVLSLATEIGLTLPDRVDVTFKDARRSKKSCFTSPRKGAFVPTVHGEARLKESYGVKKGTKSKAKEGEAD